MFYQAINLLISNKTSQNQSIIEYTKQIVCNAVKNNYLKRSNVNINNSNIGIPQSSQKVCIFYGHTEL